MCKWFCFSTVKGVEYNFYWRKAHTFVGASNLHTRGVNTNGDSLTFAGKNQNSSGSSLFSDNVFCLVGLLIQNMYVYNVSFN